MPEPSGKSQPDRGDMEAEIEARAKELMAERGLGFVDAVMAAEEELAPRPEYPKEFTVTLKAKSRVSRWVVEEFGGHREFSVEERLARYLETILNRARVQAMAIGRPAGIVREGRAVTVTKEEIARQKG